MYNDSHVYSELEKVIEESSNVTIKLDNIRICKYEIDIRDILVFELIFVNLLIYFPSSFLKIIINFMYILHIKITCFIFISFFQTWKKFKANIKLPGKLYETKDRSILLLLNVKYNDHYQWVTQG